MTYTIVGVIGHIDHGKTSLVKVLTGVDTDTHPEEKLRGITIDLGFASFTEENHGFALIDAPGHQKYIGNLLAGVSGIDVGLLVVACDQGIQEQTLEHAAILQTLGVKKLIAAISRIDLADEKMREELAEELEVFLADYGFRDIPTLPFSSVTGEGIDELKRQLCRDARTVDRPTRRLFRMPIDRVFTVPGRGCVVAGTVWSGTATVGDTVELAGGDAKPLRIRELEVHGESVESSSAGYRTAMNVTGVSANELSRGDELVAPGTHPMVTRVIVELTTFRDAPELRCPATIQFHSATTACAARVSGVRQLKPGQRVVAVVDMEQPIVATYFQQFLVRSPYPVGSFGGGRILAPVESDLRRRGLIDFGNRLVNADAPERLLAWVEQRGELTLDPIKLDLLLGIDPQRISEVVDQVVATGKVQQPADQLLVSTEAISRMSGYIVKLLTERAEQADDAWMVEESLIEKTKTAGSPAIASRVLENLLAEKQLVRVNKMVAVASEQTQLSKKQQAHMQEILSLCEDNRTPPTIKELAEHLQTKIDAVNSLVRFATQQRLLINMGGGFVIASATFADLCSDLQTLFEEQEERSVAEIRDRWQVTRKHAIPFLEYCDQAGVTRRQGNVRTAGPMLPEFLPESRVE